MKTILSLSALVFLLNTATAQKVKEAEVPKAVMESFNKSFKDVKAEKWEKEKNGNYEAEFDFNKEEMSASYSADGKLMETETEIKVSDLPASVSDYIAKNYPGKKIKEAAKIVDDKGSLSYEAEIKKGKEDLDLLFDQSGNFLREAKD